VARFYVVRHAKAGSRSHWSGDDRKRPLSKKGQQQAEAIASRLGNLRIASVFSSPYLRCVQTVEPLARKLHLEVTQSIELAEGRGVRGLYRSSTTRRSTSWSSARTATSCGSSSRT